MADTPTTNIRWACLIVFCPHHSSLTKISQTLENPNNKFTTLHTFNPHIVTTLLFHDVVFTVYINYLTTSTLSTLAQSILLTQANATLKLFDSTWCNTLLDWAYLWVHTKYWESLSSLAVHAATKMGMGSVSCRVAAAALQVYKAIHVQSGHMV